MTNLLSTRRFTFYISSFEVYCRVFKANAFCNVCQTSINEKRFFTITTDLRQYFTGYTLANVYVSQADVALRSRVHRNLYYDELLAVFNATTWQFTTSKVTKILSSKLHLLKAKTLLGNKHIKQNLTEFYYD